MTARLAQVLDLAQLDPEARARVDAALVKARPLSSSEAQALEAIGNDTRLVVGQLAKLLGRSAERTRKVISALRTRGLIDAASDATVSTGPWVVLDPTTPAGPRPKVGRPDIVRKRVWSALSSGREFTRGELASETGMSAQSIASVLRVFEASGQAERMGNGVWRRVPTSKRYSTPAAVLEGTPEDVASLDCSRRGCRVTTAACHECWSEAHLQDQRQAPGWQCPQGAHVRLETIWNLTPTARRVEAVMRHARSDDVPCPRWAYRELGLSSNAETKE